MEDGYLEWSYFGKLVEFSEMMEVIGPDEVVGQIRDAVAVVEGSMDHVYQLEVIRLMEERKLSPVGLKYLYENARKLILEELKKSGEELLYDPRLIGKILLLMADFLKVIQSDKVQKNMAITEDGTRIIGEFSLILKTEKSFLIAVITAVVDDLQRESLMQDVGGGVAMVLN